MRYISSPDFHHDAAERIGVLLVNSGTPSSTAPRDVRRFLKRMLSDPRIVELPRALWLPILHGLVLPFRPRRSARKYRKIWSASGSPLLDLSERLRTELIGTLAQRILAPLSVELGCSTASRRCRKLWPGCAPQAHSEFWWCRSSLSTAAQPPVPSMTR